MLPEGEQPKNFSQANIFIWYSCLSVTHFTTDYLSALTIAQASGSGRRLHYQQHYLAHCRVKFARYQLIDCQMILSESKSFQCAKLSPTQCCRLSLLLDNIPPEYITASQTRPGAPSRNICHWCDDFSW